MSNFNTQHTEKTWKSQILMLVDGEMGHLEKRQIFVSFHNSPCCCAYGSCTVVLKTVQMFCSQRDCSITRFSVLTLDLKFWAQNHNLNIYYNF